MTSCSDAFPTRSVRNSSVDTEAAALKVHPLGRDLTWHDFVLLASTVRSDSNPHHAGHRVNTVLSSDSFKIGTGASFIVRGLKPWMCPDSDIEAVAAKIPSIAFKKRRVGSNNGHNSSLHAALSELRILAHPPLRSHKNIVELLGMAWMKNDSPKNVISEESPLDYWPVLLLEYSSLGALPDLWKSSLAKGDLPKTEVRLKLCLDVASGLKALHDCDVVHGDLKCENVLVFKEGDIYTAKLADFGYSVTQLEKHDGLLGHTLPWNPPEDNNDFNFLGLKAADIYTLGFVIWRIMMNGDHPFMSSASGHMLDDDSILLLKKQESFWEWAFEMANAKMMKDDFFGWFSFSSFAKGLFFSTLHTTPLERSLRHTLGILAQLDMIDFQKMRIKALRNLVFLPDGKIGVDTSKLNQLKMGEILKDSPTSENPATTDNGEQDDEGSDSDTPEQHPSIEPAEDTNGAGPSELDLPERPKINLDYWSGTEEEAVAVMKKIEKRHRDPTRKFQHPTRDEESDVFEGPMVVYSYPTVTPEESRQRRIKLRQEGILPQFDPSQPCLSEFDFHFSGQKYEHVVRNKANKVFLVEGMSMFDPMFVRVTTRLQKEQPGACVEMSSQTLDLPQEHVAKGFSSRAELKITTIVDPATEVLRLVEKNGGYVEEDKWTGRTQKQVQVLPGRELLSPDLNFAKAYAALSFSISEQPLKVRQFLVKSWVDAYHLAMQPERIKLARTLFIYFLEVELDRSEALKWLLLSAEEGDLIAQPIIYRAFSALQRPLPESIPVKDWLMEGAMRGSPIAMKDLEYLDSKAIGNAKRELVCHYGGIGIDMFKDIEVLIVNLAKEVVRVAACENLGQFSDAVHLQEDLCWAKEIVSEIGASSKVASTRTDEHWSPEWDSQPVATQTHWEAYSKNRMHAFRDTFRIEEDTVYAINVVGDTILHFAASKGLVNFLTFLVETFHPPLTVLNICYETPLLQACRSGHFQTAYYLLEHDIDPFLSRRGETPLHWLFKIENNEERELLAQRLISKGVSATQTAFSPTELHLASGREPQIGTVISDSSALGWATERGCLSTLRCLLSVYSFDENHLKIAIMHASECWEAGCLHLLTTAYADQGLPKLDAEFFYTCVSRAISVLKFSGLIYPLLRHGNNWLKAFGDTRERLQAMGAEPRSSKSAALGDSGTVLQTAATCGPPEIMANLLESGWAKELNTPGFQQQVPIAMAAILGRGELFSLMLRYDNKETLPDRMVPLRDGMHIYHWLAEGKNDCLPLAKELLSLGVEYYENELRSPFEEAVRNRDFEMADFFLQRCGADIERQKDYGSSVTMVRGQMETHWVQPTLLGCLILENAQYLLPSVRYLAQRGASALVDPSLQLNIFHAWAIGGASDGDPEATEECFAELRILFPEPRHFLRLEKARVSAPLSWAVRVQNTIAVRLIVKSLGLTTKNLAFEAVGKMAWWDAKTLVSLPNIQSGALDSLQNSAALLQQVGFVSEAEAKCEDLVGLWENWLERAVLSEAEDVKHLEEQVQLWVNPTEASSQNYLH